MDLLTTLTMHHVDIIYHHLEKSYTVVIDAVGEVGAARRLLPEDLVNSYGSENEELRFGVRIYEHVSIFKSDKILITGNFYIKQFHLIGQGIVT